MQKTFPVVESVCHLAHGWRDVYGILKSVGWRLSYPVLDSSKFPRRPVAATHALKQTRVKLTHQALAQRQLRQPGDSVVGCTDIVRDLTNIT